VPVFENSAALEIAWGIRAFFNMEVAPIRKWVPESIPTSERVESIRHVVAD
jgi:hypothetical protein